MKIPLTPPSTGEILAELEDNDRLTTIFEVPPLVNGKYAHWDKVRHLESPDGLTANEWWLGIKLARNPLLKPIALLDKEGQPFKYWTPDPILRMLHEIDQSASGLIGTSEEVTNPATRNRYLINSLIEESITSSQLEGASTTVEVAKNMLRTGRQANDRSEQMILNNYLAMQFIRESRDKSLTPELVFELHRLVTEDTFDDPRKAGQFRIEADAILIQDAQGNVLHVPPPADELEDRLHLMCEFANNRSADHFLHPVIRAVILHFWVGHDHPFADGNGRTARAIFYWSMLSQGYWLAEYVSISSILKQAPSKYARSFLYSETDANDLTYFLDYQLGVLIRALAELQQYLARKIAEVRRIEALLRESVDLNHRQLALLGHAYRHDGAVYTIESHRRSHNIAYQTARTDLFDLASRELLTSRKRGRGYQFAVPTDLEQRLQAQ